MPDGSPPTALTAAERRFALWLRGLSMVFAMGTLSMVLRADGIVQDLNRMGAMVGFPVLPVPAGPVASDFWFALAVANLVGNTVSAWLASTDVRGRRALAYPVVASHLASGGAALLLLLRWSAAFPIVALAIVDLGVAGILIRTMWAAKER